MMADELSGEHGADGAIDVAHIVEYLHLFAMLERGLATPDQRAVERAFESMILALHLASRHIIRHIRAIEHPTEIKTACLPVFNAFAGIKQVRTSDQIIETADAELRHDLTDLLGDEEKEIHHVFGFTGEFLAQHRILGRHSDRTGVEMAFAHHDATTGHQWRRSKAEFVGTQQGPDHHVAAGLHLAVGLHPDPRAQAVEHQRLLRFGKPEFPRCAGVLDRGPRRRARAAIVTGNHHMIGLGLGDARGNRADPDLGDQLDADVRTRVHVFQIVDQLRQVLDRVDVVVRRWRNQTDARHRMAQVADVLADLAAR